MSVGAIDLVRARREAKRLLAAAKAGEARALARLGAVSGTPLLSHAQLAVARELGAPSWPALVRRAEAAAVAREGRAHRFVAAATRGRRDVAEALLAVAPELSRGALDAALVLGESRRVERALSLDPQLAHRPLGARGWPALLYVTHSAYLGTDRTDGLLACARLLLDAGADPDASFAHPERGPESALSGAAGAAHEPRMTALLLGAGADPDDEQSVFHAVEAEDPACLALLLGAGARVSRTMALANALRRGRADHVRMLLDHLPADAGERRFALHWAIGAATSPELVRLLVQRGADLEAWDDGAERTPYGLAVRRGRSDLAELLADLGAARRVGAVDELVGACLAGDRALAERLAAGRPETLALVRTAAAGALVEAAAERRPEAVALLLDLGVPVHTRGERADTALHAAAWSGDPGTVALLLRRGADPHKPDGLAATPLASASHGSRRASEGDHVAVAELLAAAGAEVHPGMLDDAGAELSEWLLARTPAAAPGKEPPAPSEPDYGELAARAEAAYLRLLATSPLVEVRPAGDGVAVVTGVGSNAENGVVCSRGADDALVAKLFTWFARRGAIGQWLVEDGSDLGARLVAHGAEAERSAVVMGATLAGRPAQAPVGGVEIVAVRDPSAMAAWGRVAAACHFVDAGADERHWAAVLASLGFDGPLQHRLARRAGEVVGMASYLIDGETLLGLHLGVLPAARRHGIGRALVQTPLAEPHGARAAVLAPTPDTVFFYRSLGFALRPSPPDRSFYLPPAQPESTDHRG